MEIKQKSESAYLIERLNSIAQKLNNEDIELKDEEINDLQGEFQSYFIKLYHQSLTDNFFWQYCPSTAYILQFENRFSEYNLQYPDSSQIDFINEEVQNIKDNRDYYGNGYEECFHFKYSRIWYSLDFLDRKMPLTFINREDEKNLNFTQKSKMEFLVSKLNSIYEYDKIQTENKEHEIPIDYSNNTKAERIVFLHELGILEYLQNKMNKELHGFSANKLAEIVSTFTDIGQNTAQSYLNPMFSDAVPKNNPLTENNLKKVKNKLKDIGFSTSKTI